MSEFITYDVANNIAWITINRPEKRNAMTRAMIREFAESFDRASLDSQVRVVVVTGAGGAFCAGVDLNDLASTPEDSRGEGPKPWSVLRCTKPVIGAIDGVAVGMGAEFTSMCDVRIATTRARFAWNFVARGLVPDTGAGSWLLPRLIGPQAALRLLYTGDFLSGEEALQIGYVVQVVEPEILLETAEQEAMKWAKGSPFAMSRLRDLVYRGLERTREEHLEKHREVLEECFRSDDHKEGVASFLERREAHFTGT
jgi:2-(1,2-epoxy-1,2-dihydrophenyl)acetyl-CoA isomerase